MLLERSFITGIIKRMVKDGKTVHEIADLFGLEQEGTAWREINLHITKVENAEKYEAATGDGVSDDFWKYLSVTKRQSR